MNNRAQIIGQVFIFILAGLVFVLILGYGYKAITGFMERGEEVQILDFRNELESTVTIIKRDYGSVQKLELRVPPQTEEVCFVSSTIDDPSRLREDKPLLYAAWSTGSENVFLIPRQPTPILVPDIIVENADGYLCAPAAGGKVVLRAEGTGNKASLREWAQA